MDVAYGGNFYAIIEPQNGYRGIDELGAERLLSHVMWTGRPKGTSARLAHLAGTGRLHPGEAFVHESIIGGAFIGRLQQTVDPNAIAAIIPANIPQCQSISSAP